MKSIEKMPWLASLESQTEQYLLEAIRHFQNLDESALNKPSLTGGWSITQCLAHLNSYGHYYLPRLQNGLDVQSPKAQNDRYVSSWLGAFLIRLTDPDISRMKLKAVNQHQPAGNLLAHQVVAEFIEQQETMLLMLRKAQDTDVNHFRIPLSIASWVHLPLADILHFMVVHTKRHLIQAKRNIQHL